MAKRWEGGGPVLLFIFCCQAVGFLLFCKGFLLKRVVIPEYTNCAHTHTKYTTPSLLTSNTTGSTPTPREYLQSCHSFPRPFKRVVWLIIDALRYDFMFFDDTLHHPSAYQNKIPFVRDILRDKPANARLFKFVADPPTTTMQRLKALTTGSLPTFIDAGSNFNSYTVSEDSLPWQARENQRNITFIGDDTWLGLYPDGMLVKVFDFPSLNVQDLDTVDDGVIRHLEPELALSDADLLIGHMLGVDHVGHTYGPSHWTMGKKLTQVNGFLEHMITHSLDNDTVVFVFGDHGMTPTGDHGGETSLEKDAALLVYSERPMFDPSEPAVGRVVEQVDIVPTTALVLGLPIPFSNLGKLIPEVLLPYRASHSERKTGGVENGESEGIMDGYSGRVTVDFLTALKTNAEQLHTYLTTYARYSEDFPADDFFYLEDSFRSVMKNHQKLMGLVNRLDSGVDSWPSQRDWTQVAVEFVKYMKEVKRMCGKVWAKFDNVAISQGLLLLAMVVLISTLMLLDFKSATTSLQLAISPGFVIGLVLSGVLLFVTGIDLSFLGLLAILLNISFVCLLTLLAIFAWNFRDVVIKYALSLRDRVWGLHSGNLRPVQLLATGIMAACTVAMFSNSFVLYEADMLAFFIQSLVFCLAMQTLMVEVSQSRGVSTFTLLSSVTPHLSLMVCVRISKLFYACRDLQLQDGCVSTTFLQGLASAGASLGALEKWRLAASCLSVAAVPMALIVHLRRSGTCVYLGRHLRLVCEVGLPICVVCVVVHWYQQSLPEVTKASLPHWQHVSPPLAVYLVVVIIIVVALLRPFKASIFPPSLSSCKAPLEERGEGGESLESLVLHSTKRLYEIAPRHRKLVPEEEGRAFEEFEDPPIMWDKNNGDGGYLGTAGASLLAAVLGVVVVSFWIPLAMLLNDGVALSIFLTAVEIVCALLISRRHGQGMLWEVCVLWMILSTHSFFSCGHHATIANLPIEAGFVGIHGEMTAYNLPLAAMLVGLNTMSSQILFGLGLPLLLLTNRQHQQQPELSLSKQLLPLLATYSVLHSWKLLSSVMAASLHRRHLMVWWVFAPRYLYEGAFQAVSDIAVLLGLGLVHRLERLMSAPAIKN